jgi:hypothetical protein
MGVLLSVFLLAAMALAEIQLLDTKFSGRPTVTNSGSGCPANSVSSAFSQDGTLLSYIFDVYAPRIGPSEPVTSRSKNCQLHTTINSTSGFHFAVANVSWKGALAMDPGVTLTVSTSWFMSEPTMLKPYTFNVTSEDLAKDGYRFQNSLSVPPDHLIFSRCDGPGEFMLNSKVSLSSSNTTAVGYIDNDWELTPGLSLQVGLEWRECAKASLSL